MITSEPCRLVDTEGPTGMVPALRPDDKHPLHAAYARAFGLRTWVETGTHEGHSTEAMLRSGLIDRAITMEIGEHYREACRQLFRGNRRVTVIEDGSATALPGVLASLEGPALFWLDAHAGALRGDVSLFPRRQELAALEAWGTARPEWFARSCVLVDDARFLGHGHYPTVEDVFLALAGLDVCELRDDIVRAHPKEST